MEPPKGSHEPFVRVQSCPVCGSEKSSPLRPRADGVMVLRCDACSMGFVERHPADLGLLYSDEYYSQPENGAASGYEDYDAVAAHSLGWVESFIRLLRRSGRVLDVGCANGYLLDRLGAGFQRFGIEVNDEMARKCRAKGIDIIGSDICDSATAAAYRGSFDVVTAIATLEHLVDIRGALQRIRELLSPEGAFVFEVPLLSGSRDDETWFNSSLEHIHYPAALG